VLLPVTRHVVDVSLRLGRSPGNQHIVTVFGSLSAPAVELLPRGVDELHLRLARPHMRSISKGVNDLTISSGGCPYCIQTMFRFNALLLTNSLPARRGQ
jgi:hypothetical protein